MFAAVAHPAGQRSGRASWVAGEFEGPAVRGTGKLWWSAAADDQFYELLADGQFAGRIVYEDAGGRYVFTRAFIAEGYRDRGLSVVLMRGVPGTSSSHTP